MKFSVIYSVDIPKPEPFTRNYASVRLSEVSPPKTKRGTWTKTENSRSMGADEKFNHAKWCAMLDKKQFLEFLKKCCLKASGCKTMGSIGAPGFGLGWTPAVSFEDDGSYGVFQSAYVTPLCCKYNGEPIRPKGCNERDFDRIEAKLISMF